MFEKTKINEKRPGWPIFYSTLLESKRNCSMTWATVLPSAVLVFFSTENPFYSFSLVVDRFSFEMQLSNKAISVSVSTDNFAKFRLRKNIIFCKREVEIGPTDSHTHIYRWGHFVPKWASNLWHKLKVRSRCCKLILA